MSEEIQAQVEEQIAVSDEVEVETNEADVEEVQEPRPYQFSTEIPLNEQIAQRLATLGNQVQVARHNFDQALDLVRETVGAGPEMVPVDNFARLVPVQEVQALIAQQQSQALAAAKQQAEGEESAA